MKCRASSPNKPGTLETTVTDIKTLSLIFLSSLYQSVLPQMLQSPSRGCEQKPRLCQPSVPFATRANSAMLP